MSHELRTPLNAIIGFAQIQQMHGYANAKEIRNSEHIYTAGMQLLTLVNDAMDISGIDHHHVQKAPLQTCHLNQVIDACIKFVAELALLNNITVGRDPTTACVMADPYLLKNAIKFNHQGGFVVVSVSPADSDQIRVTVQDTGVGIAKAEQQDIFEPFTRLTYAERSEINGAGIGLTLPKFLVQKMNGSIGVDSQPDNGSTFWFCLEQASQYS
jgi:signal transduction histidine kinase